MSDADEVYRQRHEIELKILKLGGWQDAANKMEMSAVTLRRAVLGTNSLDRLKEIATRLPR